MKNNSNDDEWGGAWTEKKLNAFSKYVWSYLKILKSKSQWKTIYFDGFAGSGNRKGKKSILYQQLSLTQEDENIYKGAAERVLTLQDGLLFGQEDETVTKVVKPINHIMNLYIKQLKPLWKYVTEEPLRLDNTKGRPLFHLGFATNEPVALKIAKDIIKVK